jgi:hypothetical protein
MKLEDRERSSKTLFAQAFPVNSMITSNIDVQGVTLFSGD